MQSGGVIKESDVLALTETPSQDDDDDDATARHVDEKIFHLVIRKIGSQVANSGL